MNIIIAQCITYCFTAIIIFTLPTCTHRKNIDKQTLYITPGQKFIPLTTDDTPPPITIWIHGTIFFGKPSPYEDFCKNPRLVPMTQLPKNHRLRQVGETIVENDPEHFNADEFYIFGWSGGLREKERRRVAEKLYHDLVDLTQKYQKKYGIYPIIRIIAHSHGGNVALHMAKIKNVSSNPLSVRSLILLACPVQERTMYALETPMFQRIYSLYSSLDLIQVLAPQLRYTDITKHNSGKRYKIPAFSSRLFPQRPHVIQAKIKVDNYPLYHTFFSSPQFAQLLPKILRKLDSWDTQTSNNTTIKKYKLLCVHRTRLRSPFAPYFAKASSGLCKATEDR
jgi:hypothetical protein